MAAPPACRMRAVSEELACVWCVGLFLFNVSAALVAMVLLCRRRLLSISGFLGAFDVAKAASERSLERPVYAAEDAMH